MQAVPSLVGTGTAVAAATAGLVFGQTSEANPPTPGAAKRNIAPTSENSTLPSVAFPSGMPSVPHAHLMDGHAESFSKLSIEALPSTSASQRQSRPSTAAQTTPPKTLSRRYSAIRQSDNVPPPISEFSRDSFSSNGSWMRRRWSIRPMSQHGSPRSSVGPDSPSLNFSQGSVAPILPSGSAIPPQLPPNKLVKHSTIRQDSAGTTLTTQSRSRSQRHTLRRPATSHQRSATLQFQYPTDHVASSHVPRYSLDQGVKQLPVRIQTDGYQSKQEATRSWSSFFHLRTTKPPGRGNNARPIESSPGNTSLPSRRIHLRQGSLPRAYLISTAMMAGSPAPRSPVEAITGPTESSPSAKSTSQTASSEGTPSKRARRSISMHFSSPSSWISRTGSLRRPKRSMDGKAGGKRHVSDPVSFPQDAVSVNLRRAVEDIFIPPSASQAARPQVAANAVSKSRQRNSSSPLPPLSRLSSFNVDLNRLAVSSSSGSKDAGCQHSFGDPTIPGFYVPYSRNVSNERESTMTSSDLEMRCFSGDDEDTDFKSDTMFDSVRTAASNPRRAVETPIESMFDESPPSTAGNSKTKRHSIQEILGRSWDGDTKIMEEDEGISTPIRGARSFQLMAPVHIVERPSTEERPSNDFSMTNRPSGRPSLDDEDHDNWLGMDENGVMHHLSPPSSTVNSRGVSPNLRMALASISGNVSPESVPADSISERPRSTLFDWSEPPTHDKFEEGSFQSPRPKTVHGKQEMDSRGGRSANRKGPAAAHVRSQSVPAVAEPSENLRATSKFGTWASGPKTTSEDWDDDFDFEADSGAVIQGKATASTTSMVVPASIQATQPTVRAHSGQIREFSLLVNDLKRLCRHGRNLDILNDSPLWKEAENVIALASPDEDVDEPSSPESADFDPSDIEDRFLDEGFDANTIHSLEDPFDLPLTDIAKTAVIRERHTTKRPSVFSPEDDIFGNNWPLNEENNYPTRPQTPDRSRGPEHADSTTISSIMEAMQLQRSSSAPMKGSPVKPSKAELFFNTNTLHELVKRASSLFLALSELVRRAELITQSPACTPRHERHRLRDGSPAFTRVFTDPSSPSKKLPKSRSNNSVLRAKGSLESSNPKGLGKHMQMMTVN